MGGSVTVRSLAEIMEEMRKRYQQYPKLRKHWRVLAGGDDYGYSDFYFYAPDLGIWQIKGELKSPHELVGAGAFVARKIDDEIREIMEQGMPMPFGLISPHPEYRNRAIIAAGIGRHQESMERMKGALPGSARKTETELRQKLNDIRRKLGLDRAYR